MMKRVYFTIPVILIISIVLLGISFSLESGINNEAYIVSDVSDKYKIVFSDDEYINTGDDNFNVFGLTNLTSEKTMYKLVLKEVDDLKYKDIYYVLNGGEETKLKDNTILLGELDGFGAFGDYGTYELLIYSKCNALYNFEISIEIVEDKKDTFDYVILDDKNVYTDNLGNTRYFGVEVNNYIKYNGEIHRIIGIIDGKIKIISEIKGLGVYDLAVGNYLSIKDYLGTFNIDGISSNNVMNYDSWIEDKGYWLSDTIDDKAYYGSATYGIGTNLKNVDYYLRYVYEIPVNSVLISGDGSLNNPYEVSYGS